ncbi:MAG: ferrochelatase, partial [Kiloniellales bacterium]
VGPLRWIGPATDAEIRRAGAERRPLAIFPLAFVSEHLETLVELDIEYRKLAEAAGVPAYHRVPTVMAGARFIEALAEASLAAVKRPPGIASLGGGRFCPETFGGCLCRQPGRAS